MMSKYSYLDSDIEAVRTKVNEITPKVMKYIEDNIADERNVCQALAWMNSVREAQVREVLKAVLEMEGVLR